MSDELVKLINAAGEEISVPVWMKIQLKKYFLLRWDKKEKAYQIKQSAADLLAGFNCIRTPALRAIDYSKAKSACEQFNRKQNVYERLGVCRKSVKTEEVTTA